MDAAAIIAAFGVVVAAVAAGTSIWNTIKIRETHLTINSRLDELLRSSKAEAFSAGAADARATDRAIAAADTASTADAAAKVLATAIDAAIARRQDPTRR